MSQFDEVDTGNEGIQITAAALKAAQRYLDEVEAYRGQDLRLYLSGKGCDGFEYGVAFSKEEPGDQSYPAGENLRILVDPKTLTFVRGATIDFVDDERGRGFLVNNPAHKKFRGKFYKRENWQERLLGSPEA